jgi:hypothetical protein
MKTKLLGLMAFVSLLGFAPASADTIYTYTGNDFTTVSGPYTTTDMVTGTIDLATALGDNFGPAASIVPVSFSFSDGVQTVTNLSPEISATFTDFSTDASGVPLTWDVILFDYVMATGTENVIETWNLFSTANFQQDEGNDGYGIGYGANQSNAGFWAMSSSTPLPAALPLFATGLGALGLFGLHRKRKNAAIAA